MPEESEENLRILLDQAKRERNEALEKLRLVDAYGLGLEDTCPVPSIQAKLEGYRDLVRRAVHGAGRNLPAGPRWSHVTRVFAIGSTRAAALCEEFNMDPDVFIGRVSRARDTQPDRE